MSLHISLNPTYFAWTSNCQLVFSILLAPQQARLPSQRQAAVWSAALVFGVMMFTEPLNIFTNAVWVLHFSLKALDLSISAGDNPFLCRDLVLILSHFELATESCLNTNIWWNMIRTEGGEDLEKKNQTEGNTQEECFSVTREPASLPRKSVSYT